MRRDLFLFITLLSIVLLACFGLEVEFTAKFAELFSIENTVFILGRYEPLLSWLAP